MGVTRGLNGGRGSACVGSLAARTVDVVVEVRVFVQLAAGWRGGSGRRVSVRWASPIAVPLDEACMLYWF